MSQKRRQFTREFKLEAVRLVKCGQSVSRVAAQLGIRPDMLRAWKRQVDGSEGSLKEALRGDGRVTSREHELRRLRQELARVTEERDFLKKAAAYFAKEKPGSTPASACTGNSFRCSGCVEHCRLVAPASMGRNGEPAVREHGKMSS